MGIVLPLTACNDLLGSKVAPGHHFCGKTDVHAPVSIRKNLLEFKSLIRGLQSPSFSVAATTSCTAFSNFTSHICWALGLRVYGPQITCSTWALPSSLDEKSAYIFSLFSVNSWSMSIRVAIFILFAVSSLLLSWFCQRKLFLTGGVV